MGRGRRVISPAIFGRMSDTPYLIALNAEAAAGWWLLVPAGRFGGRDGRQWVNDRPDDVIAAIRAMNRQVVLDEEHSTEIRGAKGEPAPARGFFVDYQNRQGAIYGKVELNAIGAQRLKDREYKYYSPAYYYEPATRRITGLSSVALTNKHNLDLPALNTQQPKESAKESPMDYKAIAVALGLNTDATETQIIAAINAIKSQRQTALNSAEMPDPEKYVPMETHRLALNRAEQAEQTLARNKETALKAEAAALIDQAVKDCKIAPANRDHYLALCRDEANLGSVKAMLQAAPKIIVDTAGLDGDPARPKTALNQEESQVAALLGMTAKEFAEAKAQA